MNTNPGLMIGRLCRKRLHMINSMADINVSHRKTGGPAQYRCKECKKTVDRKYRARNSLKDNRDHTLLGRGRCRYDHKLSSKDDLVVVQYRHGKPIHACKACREDPNKMLRATSVDRPHPLLLKCGCSPYFRPPMPSVGDFIYCSLHNTGTEVLKWV